MDHSYVPVIDPPPQSDAAPQPAVSEEAGVAVSDDKEDYASLADEPHTVSLEETNDDSEGSMVRCICGFQDDSGTMICCDMCNVWQHLDCIDVPVDTILDTYLCELCSPHPVDKGRAIRLQIRQRKEKQFATRKKPVMHDHVPGWQDNKSLHERNRYMLENEIATDVCFEFSSPEGGVTLVRAHEYMLVTSSPVFEAMFCGGMAEACPDRDNILIQDIDAKTFKEMLRYIYCENVDITVDSAFPLMYAAKKYMLTGLVSKFFEEMEKSITVETVCTILDQSIFFAEDVLKEKCLSFISKVAFLVFATEGFMRLNRDILKSIASLNAVLFTEKCLFEGCVRWARRQLLESGNENSSDRDIRDQLGDILYEIRLPAMTLKGFAELTAHSEVLTTDEKHAVYVFMATGEKLDNLKFVTESRYKIGENEITRLKVSSFDHWNCKGGAAVAFQTTVDIVLTGVGLYGGSHGSVHDVMLMVIKDKVLLSKTVTKMTSDGTESPIGIGLDTPVLISANRWHMVVVTMKGCRTWSGFSDVACYKLKESGSITFQDAKLIISDASYGQIPQLYYVHLPRPPIARNEQPSA